MIPGLVAVGLFLSASPAGAHEPPLKILVAEGVFLIQRRPPFDRTIPNRKIGRPPLPFGTDGEHQTLEIMVSGAPGGERRLSFYFDEEDGGITLWQYAGDPDAWKYMEFRKSEKAG